LYLLAANSKPANLRFAKKERCSKFPNNLVIHSIGASVDKTLEFCTVKGFNELGKCKTRFKHIKRAAHLSSPLLCVGFDMLNG